jgi:ubiquinone/menaquinone biosynthesis C-methylase UbiE
MSTLSAVKVRVPGKFDGIASTYDLLTGANPGYHRHLRMSARHLGLSGQARILDLCCGTGSSTAAVRAVCPDAHITGLDASAGMLQQARKKTELGATFVHGDAMDPAASPRVEGPYDGIFMAYGIRNMPDPDLCLDRLHTLLRPGGVIVFHEYSVADSLWARIVWTLVCWLVIIPGGLFTAPKSDIYLYLWRSAIDFDGIQAFERRLKARGFDRVETQPLDGWQRGITHTIIARVPETPA